MAGGGGAAARAGKGVRTDGNTAGAGAGLVAPPSEISFPSRSGAFGAATGVFGSLGAADTGEVGLEDGAVVMGDWPTFDFAPAKIGRASGRVSLGLLGETLVTLAALVVCEAGGGTIVLRTAGSLPVSCKESFGGPPSRFSRETRWSSLVPE